MYNYYNIIQQNNIDLNSPIPPMEKDEFVLQNNAETSPSWPNFFNFDDNQNLIFPFQNYQEDSPESRIFFENKILDKKKDEQKTLIGETSTGVTDKKTNTDKHKIQITNLLNGDTEEVDLEINEEKSKTTQANILLGKKRKKVNEEKKIHKNNYKNCGRKKKDSGEKGNHTKNKEDNMIAKLKNYIFNSILNLLNKSFIYITSKFNKPRKNDYENEFLKIDSKITHSIKKENNLSLLDMKLKNVLSNKISSKYSTIDEDHNIKLIQKIYEEKKETNLINILELTFREILDVFRGTVSAELEKKINEINNMKEKFTNIGEFFEKIKKQEIDKKEKEDFIVNYMANLKELCMNFQSWFSDKNGRNRK